MLKNKDVNKATKINCTEPNCDIPVSSVQFRRSIRMRLIKTEK